MIQMTEDYILVKPQERVKSAILEVIMSEPPNIGEIVAVGPGKYHKKHFHRLDVRPGQKIRFGTDQGYLKYPEHTIDGQRYLIMQEDDVCWIIEGEESCH
jgi:co-chaperonin GroES (HSP10)